MRDLKFQIRNPGSPLCALRALRGELFLPALLLATLPGCQQESRVVRYKPFLSNVAGAEFSGQGPVNPAAGYADPTAVPDNRIVLEHPDGSRTLIARSVQHLITHMQSCLMEGADELMLEQVISEKAKLHYRSRGEDPMALVESLKKNRKEVMKTLARMPLGESTPTVVLRQPGDKTWTLKLTGAAARDLKFTRLWARMESGNWRFVWLD
jgi:hypothetical protein